MDEFQPGDVIRTKQWQVAVFSDGQKNYLFVNKYEIVEVCNDSIVVKRTDFEDPKPCAIMFDDLKGTRAELADRARKVWRVGRDGFYDWRDPT